MISDNLIHEVNNRVFDIHDLFRKFLEEFVIDDVKAKMHGHSLYRSIHTYFNDTKVMKYRHSAIHRTNDSKKFAFIVKAINSVKPIIFNGHANLYLERYINEIFSIYCGLHHIEDKEIRDIVLHNMENFVYLIFNQEMNYLQLSLTMDLIFKKEKGK